MAISELINKVVNKYTKKEVVDGLVASFEEFLPIYEINSPLRLCAFLSQMAHETMCFRYFVELGNVKYFEKYEPSTAIGIRLGNKNSGDGYRYRGRGLIMLTGRKNYEAYSRIIDSDLIENPDLAAKFPYSTQISCEFWNRNKLSYLADRSLMEDITRKINGGLNGIEDRMAIYKKLLECVNVN